MDGEIVYALTFLVLFLLPFVVVTEFNIQRGRYNMTFFQSTAHFMAKIMICVVFVLFLTEWYFLSLGVS